MMGYRINPFSLKMTYPLEGEVGPQGRVGGDATAFPVTAGRLNHTPHPPTLRVIDLPLKWGGVFIRLVRYVVGAKHAALLAPSPQRGEGRGEGVFKAAFTVTLFLLLTACAHPDQAASLICHPETTPVALTPSSAYRENSIDDLKSLASGGDKAAARVLGERYQFGDGAPVDLKQAAQWYERAAFIPPTTSFVYMPGYGKTPGAQIPVTVGQTGPGDTIALGRLGLLYRNGQGVKADLARADELLSCAATRGATLNGDQTLLDNRFSEIGKS